ncbi:hypothetical protein [Sinimarinibacterium thermocellulolyticum]|uniref:Outer membrane protein beta-barrel domain-containing protein n=1 Tax=Sinimarinibacterium thermocellulolyticum TaxID=3170016 RepID=A0ABV2A914_9GAMM
MNKLTCLAAGLLLCNAVFAQDDGDTQAGNSFADINAADQSSDTPDANSFSSDTQDANRFTSDTSDANRFTSDTSDANSFASDGSDANSFGDGFDDSGTSGDEAAPEEAQPWALYAGADVVWTTASFSSQALIDAFGGDRFDSRMYRVRAGLRLFDAIGLEAQLGAGDSGVGELAADEFSTERFYAVYFVPTGVLLDLIEVGASIGYAHVDLERPGASEAINGASFGVNVEIPVYTSDALELRIGGGAATYRAQPSARIYGYHAGLRLDFRV